MASRNSSESLTTARPHTAEPPYSKSPRFSAAPEGGGAHAVDSGGGGGLEASSRYAAEFVGTFMLVFTICCVSVVGDPVWNATAIACILMVSIYSLGPVSGANLNPAVSVSLGLAGKLAWPVVGGYVAMQVIAGILAALASVFVFGQQVPLAPKGDFGFLEVFIVEALYTAMLCFVVINCAASLRNNPKDDQNHFFALAIGFVIVSGGYAAGGISGASFNPAVSLGLDIVSFRDGIWWGFAYSAFELLGAVLGAALFRVCRPEDYASMPEFQLSRYVPPLAPRLVSEFFGTFVLVVTVGLNVLMKSPATAWSAGAALMCMVYALGDVSGAHFNPAVTLAIVLSRRGKCAPANGLCYAGVQIVAGVLAGLLFSRFHAKGPLRDEVFGLAPAKDYSWFATFGAEVFFTFVLAFVVLACATTTLPPSPSRGNFYFGLAIGSCVTAGGFAIGSVSGGELNPAVSLGISAGSLASPRLGVAAPFWLNCVWFSAFELLGGAAAAGVFTLTHPGEFKYGRGDR